MAGMTPLTGMTASQAAEELRRRADMAGPTRTGVTPHVFMPSAEALHMASLLEQGARDTELLSCAEAIMQIAPQAPAGHFANTDCISATVAEGHK